MRSLLIYAGLVCAAAIFVYPFVWMLATSLKSLQEATQGGLGLIPSVWHWENYAQTFGAAPFGRYFLNSFFVAGCVALGTMLTGLMAAYAFARLRFPGRDVLFVVVLLTMMVPFEVALVPNFVLIGKLGWYNTHAALIVPWLASGFAIFLLRQALRALPGDFYDAARVDGCGHLRFLVQIAAPMVKPMLLTVALFAFLGSYNALLWPLVVTTDDRARVVQVGLMTFMSDYGVRLHLLMCASTIIILPTVALYFFTQRAFVESTLGSGLKS